MKKPPTSYLPLFPYLGAQKDSIVADGELVVVNFAGIGGACKGLEKALGRPVTHAINHSATAISLHRVNSPHTTHHIQDVWQVNPETLAGGRRIAVAWFSPDCKHFSKAKGGKPVEKNIRDLAWVVTNYTGLPEHIRPRLGFLENVEEFADWGPLGPDGKPDKNRKGETFREFVGTLEAQGYEVQTRLLKACDYGAPTTRKRLFMIFRCDGQPIQWPSPTHGHPDSPAVRAGKLLPWRTAAEIIDWDIPCPSIFTRKKPLVDNTLRRVARGLKKYVKEAKKPYIVTCNHGGDGFRGQDVDEPLRTITAAHDATGVVDPLLTPFVTNKQFGAPSRPVSLPLSTITTNHNKQELVMPYLTPRFGQFPGHHPRTRPVNMPLATLTTGTNNATLAAALLVRSGHFSNITGEGAHFRGQSVERPISTITAAGNDKMVTLAHLTKFRTNSTGTAINEPMHTITAGAPRTGTGAAQGLVAANLVQFYGLKTPTETRGQSLEMPLKTQTTENRHALVTANLVKHYGGGYTGSGIGMNQPTDTITTQDHHALMTANLVKYYGRSHGQSAGIPIGTVTTNDRFGLSCATLVRQFGTSRAADVAKPVGTIVANGGGKTHLLRADLVPGLTAEQSQMARLVYDLMARFAPDALSERDHAHRAVLVVVDGVEYVIADVGMRMLTPRELARGQSFEDDYVLEYGADGQPITKTAQVNGIGNSVCPVVAKAIASANVQVWGEAAD